MVARLKLKGIDALGFRGKRKKRAQRKERSSWDARGVGSSCPRVRGPFSLGRLGRLVLCIFYPRNKPSPHQSPTFGPILYKFIVMGPVRKSRPYKYNSYDMYPCIK